MRVRVLTLNVQNEEGDARRAEMINRTLRRIDPDLVALQEVPARDSLQGLATLLAALPLTAVHQDDLLGYSMPYADRYGGAALAARWPYRIVEVLDQRGADARDVPWCTLAATVELPQMGPLLFVATTLSWRLDAEAAREHQAVALTDLDARHRTELPSLLAGDLNAAPDAPVSVSSPVAGHCMAAAFTTTTAGPRLTPAGTLETRGPSTIPARWPRSTRSCASCTTVAAWTTCLWAPGTLIRTRGPRCAPPISSCPSPWAECNPATTTDCWSTLTSTFDAPAGS